jgi:lipopolysaccharide heptosyltransferase II
MYSGDPLTSTAVRLARLPLRLAIRPADFVPPRKALILKPCCLSQVMLTTPLLGVLQAAYPQAKFDWAISDWARPAIASHPAVQRLIRTGSLGQGRIRWRELRGLVAELRAQAYDTCFIPSGSALLSLVAWLAGIPQRVGLDIHGRGLAHTTAVVPRTTAQHTATLYLELAQALGIETNSHTVRPRFFPTDPQRAAVTARLVDEVGWLGDVPLVIIHPGGGHNPVQPNPNRCWPVERFARLATYLVRHYHARILLVSGSDEAGLVQKLTGIIPTAVTNWAGQLTLGELGALSEIASLYIGHDSGPTHIAAAVGCPTLAIYGPTDPQYTAPLGPHVQTIWQPYTEPFSWDKGVTSDQAIAAAQQLLP